MKEAVAKSWNFVSHLGGATFHNVPVLVDDHCSVKRGFVEDAFLKDAALSGSSVERMEREVAKTWIGHFIGDNPRDIGSLTPNEISNILILINIKKAEFADLLQISKGSVTKFIKGSMKPTAPVCLLMLGLLAVELVNPGRVRKFSDLKQSIIPGINVPMRTIPKAEFDLKVA